MVGTTDARTADDDEAWSRDWPLVIMRKCQNPERLMTMEPRLAAGHNEEMPERLMTMEPRLAAGHNEEMPERLMTMEPRLAAGHNEEMPERLMMMGPELWPLIMLAEADDNDGRNDR